MPAIPITLKGNVVSMPVDFEVPRLDKDGNPVSLTWEIFSGGERVTVPWLVSFRDGTTFDVGEAKLTTKEVVVEKATRKSPDIRNGEGIVFSRDVEKVGRHSYRFAFEYGGKIYGVFDCPSIIIT